MDRELSDLMEFDHVIRVQDGHATDREPNGDRIALYAPACTWEGDTHHVDPGWQLLDGYSGQDRYSGPIMHPSEYVGGRLEEAILADDGYYVCVMCEVLDDPDHDYSVENPEPAGWAVAYRPLTD